MLLTNIVATSAELPHTWKVAGRGWGHSLHKLSQYIGAFPPSLAHFFIAQLSDEGQTVFDPFSGGGTTALEALIMGRRAVASDAFYYAYVLTHGKIQPMGLDEFCEYLRSKLAEASSVSPSPAELENDDLLASYSPSTLRQVVQLREVLRGDESREALFTKAVICGVLHGPSTMFLSLPQKDTVSSTPGYVRRFARAHSLQAPDRDVFASAMNKATRCLKDGLPAATGSVYLQDSRNLAHISNESVDLIVTSPPYLRVLDYSWNNWVRIWWLAKDRKEERQRLLLTSREDKYRDFMRGTLSEMYRVMRPNTAAVIVVGDVKRGSNDKVQVINSAMLIAEEAKTVGFRVDALINDTYDLHSRSMLVYNSLKWDYAPSAHEARSSVLIDRCLVLAKGSIKWRERSIDWTRTGQMALDVSGASPKT